MASSPDDSAGQVLTELVLELFRLNGRLLAAGDRLARPFGQTSARWQVLGAIQIDQRTVSQIARVMGLTRQSVQRSVDRLEAGGLVSYADNPAHKRARLVALTARGRSVLERIVRREESWSAALAAPLGPTRLRSALGVIRTVRQALESAERATRSRGTRSVSGRSEAKP